MFKTRCILELCFTRGYQRVKLCVTMKCVVWGYSSFELDFSDKCYAKKVSRSLRSKASFRASGLSLTYHESLTIIPPALLYWLWHQNPGISPLLLQALRRIPGEEYPCGTSTVYVDRFCTVDAPWSSLLSGSQYVHHKLWERSWIFYILHIKPESKCTSLQRV